MLKLKVVKSILKCYLLKKSWLGAIVKMCICLAFISLVSGCSIFSQQYDFISDLTVEKRIDQTKSIPGHTYKNDAFLFNNINSFYKMEEDGKYNYYTRNPRTRQIWRVTTDGYEYTKMPSDGNICAVKKDGKWGYIIFKLEYKIDQGESQFNEAPIVTINNITSFEFDMAEPFTEGLGAVKKDGLYGFIDESGKEVLPFKYEEATYFAKGYAAVKDNTGWYYINKKGDLVAGPFEEAEPFVASRLLMENNKLYDNYMALYKENGKWGILNKDAKKFVSPQFDDVFVSSDEKITYVFKDGEWTTIPWSNYFPGGKKK